MGKLLFANLFYGGTEAMYFEEGNTQWNNEYYKKSLYLKYSCKILKTDFRFLKVKKYFLLVILIITIM